MAIPNGLNPNLTAISLGAGSVVICAGVASTAAAVDTDVKAQVGDVGYGSLYISQATGRIWIKLAAGYTTTVSYTA